MSARASLFTRPPRFRGVRFVPFGLFTSRHRRRFADLFVPRRPRHPLLRVALALLGLAVIAFLVVLGLIVGTAMLAVGLAWRGWRRRGRPTAAAAATGAAAHGTIEGEYRVLRKPVLPSRLASVR